MVPPGRGGSTRRKRRTVSTDKKQTGRRDRWYETRQLLDVSIVCLVDTMAYYLPVTARVLLKVVPAPTARVLPTLKEEVRVAAPEDDWGGGVLIGLQDRK